MGNGAGRLPRLPPGSPTAARSRSQGQSSEPEVGAQGQSSDSQSGAQGQSSEAESQGQSSRLRRVQFAESGSDKESSLSPIAPIRAKRNFRTFENLTGTKNEGDTVLLMAKVGYRLIKLIGKGAYGEVYEAEKQDSSADKDRLGSDKDRLTSDKDRFQSDKRKRKVAIKIQKMDKWPSWYLEHHRDVEIPREITILKTYHHPYIVPYLDAYQEIKKSDKTLRRVFIVTDLAKSDLDQLIRDSGGRLQELAGKVLMRQLASALEFLHSHSVCHLDLKPGNVLIGYQDQVLLSDFGLAEENASKNNLNQDIWDFGIVIIITISGIVPEINNQIDLTWLIHETCDKIFSPDLKHLLDNIFCHQDNRLSMSQILQHRWILAGAAKDQINFDCNLCDSVSDQDQEIRARQGSDSSQKSR